MKSGNRGEKRRESVQWLCLGVGSEIERSLGEFRRSDRRQERSGRKGADQNQSITNSVPIESGLSPHPPSLSLVLHPFSLRFSLVNCNGRVKSSSPVKRDNQR